MNGIIHPSFYDGFGKGKRYAFVITRSKLNTQERGDDLMDPL
jgi:hypothetical protein